MTTRKHEGRTIRHEITIDASPDDVWDAWAKHDRIDHWFVDRQTGDMDRDAIVKWAFDTFGIEMPVHVFEARRGEYLAFGGGPDASPRALQEIVLRQEGGSTVLRLANSGFLEGDAWDEEYRGVDSGWRMALATLKFWLEHHGNEPRTHVVITRPAAFEYEALMRLFATSEGLTQWLATRAEPIELREGAAVKLDWIGGGRLTGEVLARSATELCVSWSEMRGLLTFKAFKMGPTRAAGLSFDGWGLDEGQRSAITLLLTNAVERLVAQLGPTVPLPQADVPNLASRGQA
jgi:uncharacterized protein YndB with AHSA1/START domain